MSLILEGVHAYYGLSHILHGIDLAVKHGETVGLLGRNGAGKSTTLKAVMGFVPPKKGMIRFEGDVVSGLKPYQIAKRGIAYVPESREVFSYLSVEENLTLGKAANSQWTLEKVISCFPPLKELLPRKGNTLSGGQQQMLVIGRALMTGPRLVLLDEPSQGLAPIVVNVVLGMLKDLRKENLGILLVEQRIKMALELAEKVYILANGEIVHMSSPEELSRDTDMLGRYIGLSV
jgi:branched-chain amino acid transport system ATP-binding protein